MAERLPSFIFVSAGFLPLCFVAVVSVAGPEPPSYAPEVVGGAVPPAPGSGADTTAGVSVGGLVDASGVSMVVLELKHVSKHPGDLRELWELRTQKGRIHKTKDG